MCLYLQNAYTATAINSTNFCTSARDAFFILVENALRVAAINSVGDFVLFLGKVFIQLPIILQRIQCYKHTYILLHQLSKKLKSKVKTEIKIY